MAASSPPGVLSRFAARFGEDAVTTQAAALSFYITLALAPALLLVLTLLSVLPATSQEAAVARIVSAAGDEIEPFIRTLVDGADAQPNLRNLAGWLSLLMVLVGASALFAMLQQAVNAIWRAEDRHLSGLWATLRRRMASILLLVVLVAISIAASIAQHLLPEGAWLWLAIGWTVGAAVHVALFAAMYRFLPDRRVAWSTVLRAGAITAVLFVLGRIGVSVYFSHSDVAGAFGLFGGVIVWLVWAYYMGIVFLASAVLVRVLAEHRGWAWFDDEDVDGTRADRNIIPS